jgi:hypothetical protein
MDLMFESRHLMFESRHLISYNMDFPGGYYESIVMGILVVSE